MKMPVCIKLVYLEDLQILKTKLVSLEMNNAQYAIRDPISKKYNNTSDYKS